jgi:hypothetical protein
VSTDKVQVNVRVTRQLRDLIRLLAYTQENKETEVIEAAIKTYGLLHLNWMIRWDLHKTEPEKFQFLLRTVSLADDFEYYYNEETNQIEYCLENECWTVDSLLTEALDGFMGFNCNVED